MTVPTDGEEIVVPTGWESGMDIDIQGLYNFFSAAVQQDEVVSNEISHLGLELGGEWSLEQVTPPTSAGVGLLF